jgi:hypothetical protein
MHPEAERIIFEARRAIKMMGVEPLLVAVQKEFIATGVIGLLDGVIDEHASHAEVA